MAATDPLPSSHSSLANAGRTMHDPGSGAGRPYNVRMNDPERIVAVYEVRAAAGEADGLARRIACEQTVELPLALVTDPTVRERVLGRVEAVRRSGSPSDPGGAGGGTASGASAHPGSDAGAGGGPGAASPDPDGGRNRAGQASPDGGGAGSSASGVHRVTVSYCADLANAQIPQLLNLLYGNVSLYPGVRLVDVSLPAPVLAALAGPRFGVEGVRRLTGVYGRPLLATALKPRGLPAAQYAHMAGAFALGGGDLVKDDQNLVAGFDEFRERVLRCRDAVDDANARTGRKCLYFPLATAPLESIERHLDFVRAAGLHGVLLCPGVLGLDTARALAARHDLVFMAHPSLAGTLAQGIDPGLVFGTLLRLAGADISVFPDQRGRFSFAGRTCAAIRDRLCEPLGGLRPAWPCPAGGLRFDGIGAACTDYGENSILLIGGALLGHAARLEDGTRAFAERIAECFPGHRIEPALPGAPPDPGTFLPFRPGFEWEGRDSSAYRTTGASGTSDAPAFRGVRRVELVGRFGEPTRSDLRYFEVEPGGHTSHERHTHPHIIIGARGEGRLVMGKRQVAMRPHDVAFVPPLEPHQLRNEANEPFGFFCIVDHDRDRPLPA